MGGEIYKHFFLFICDLVPPHCHIALFSHKFSATSAQDTGFFLSFPAW